jgi:hypothetical protein
MAITASFSPRAGALPPARLFAHLGYDVLTGGSGNDQLFGRCCGDRHHG